MRNKLFPRRGDFFRNSIRLFKLRFLADFCSSLSPALWIWFSRSMQKSAEKSSITRGYFRASPNAGSLFLLRMYHFLVPIMLLMISPLFCDLGDHLREIREKTKGHSIRNIDFIYLINLDQRPEKLKSSLDQLSSYGIHPFRFSAVNGWELSLEDLDDVGLKFCIGMEGGELATRYPLGNNFEPSHEPLVQYGKTYFSHCMSRGAIGIILSHLSILRDAYEAGYETIWVMEDDIEVLQNPHSLSDLIDRLDQVVGKGKWDILFTDRDIRDSNGNSSPCYAAKSRPDFKMSTSGNDFAKRTAVSADFTKIGARWGAHSMILRRSGIRKLLQYFSAHQIFFPYDMEYILPPGIKLYAVSQDVVSNLPKAASDNGGPNYAP